VAAASRLVRLDEANELLFEGVMLVERLRLILLVLLSLVQICFLRALIHHHFSKKFEFKHIHLFCRRCGRVGHRPIDCPSSSMVASPLQVTNQSPNLSKDVEMAPEADPVHADDDSPPLMPWIHVRRR